MNTPNFREMTTAERLQAMEALWDCLLQDDAQIATPDWHGKILEERRASMANGTAQFMSLSELKGSRGQ